MWPSLKGRREDEAMRVSCVNCAGRFKFDRLSFSQILTGAHGMSFSLECLNCHVSVPSTVHRLRCDSCGGLFRVAYDDAPMGEAPRLPFSDGDALIFLGEGRTPLVKLSRTAEALGLGALWAKLEFMAPTGSFKDRGSAVLVSVAKRESVTEFVEDSSGNAGASLSAYAAAAGMKAHVFVPASAARGKLDQIRIFGAELHAVEGPRQAATDAAEEFLERRGLPYLSHNLSPFFSEGMKAFAYEVAGSDAAGVEHVVLPVGNGSLLIGVKAGFDELAQAGKAQSPHFHCVQAESVRPIEAAINGDDWKAGQARPTIASGIAVSAPPRLGQCVEAVRSSGGSAVAVADEIALAWQRRLAREEGIFCEATSAAAFAGLERLVRDGVIGQGSRVLVPVTGSGLKEPVSS